MRCKVVLRAYSRNSTSPSLLFALLLKMTAVLVCSYRLTKKLSLVDLSFLLISMDSL